MEEDIANFLQVDDIDAAKNKAQGVLDVQDDTDLDKAAEFNIFEYLKNKGVSFMDQFEQEAPKSKQIQDMKKELTVPYSKEGIS